MPEALDKSVSINVLNAPTAVRSGCANACGVMQACVRRLVSAPVAASGMLVSPGRSLETSESASCSIGTGRSSWFHHSSSMAMVSGVFPATMSREKATIRPSSAVLFA